MPHSFGKTHLGKGVDNWICQWVVLLSPAPLLKTAFPHIYRCYQPFPKTNQPLGKLQLLFPTSLNKRFVSVRRTAESHRGAGRMSSGRSEHASPAPLRFLYCKAGCFIMLQFPRTLPSPVRNSHEPICMTQLENSQGGEQGGTGVDTADHSQNLQKPAHCNVLYEWRFMVKYKPPSRHNPCLFSTKLSPIVDIILFV